MKHLKIIELEIKNEEEIIIAQELNGVLSEIILHKQQVPKLIEWLNNAVKEMEQPK